MNETRAVWTLTIDTEALELARNQFVPLCGSWNYNDWDEFDYGKIKNLNFREIDDQRRKEGQVATERECLKCPDFLKHVSTELVLSI